MSDGVGAGDPSIQLSGSRIPSPAAEPEIDQMVSCNEVANVEVMFPISDVAELSKPAACLSLAIVDEVDTQMISHCDEDDSKTSSHYEAMNEDKIEHEHQTEADATGQKKLLKKPDKILPCPRCNSLNTKFCYYNNYNVNQPRHFCKNCHRYWTAGGIMRNVPVGSGKRKSKSSSQHCQIALSNDGVACRQSSDVSSLKENSNVLQAPLCESTTSLLNLKDQKSSSLGSLPHAGKNDDMPSLNCAENNLCEGTASSDQNCTKCHSNGLSSVNPLQVFPFAPWMCPWPPGWYNNPSMMPGMWPSELVYKPENLGLNTMPCHPLQMPAPPYSMPVLPFPIFPASFWGSMTSWPNGTLHGSFARPDGSLSPSSTTNTGCLQNGSSTLGKHYRDATSQGEPEKEKYLWVPKTLRIHDPDEAAKSSIWETLGIKPDDSIIKGGIFKSLNSKSKNKDQSSDAACVLLANPAALSRSQAFQEST